MNNIQSETVLDNPNIDGKQFDIAWVGVSWPESTRLRNHFWPLESRFLMRKSEEKGPNFFGPKGRILKFTYSESSHQIRQIG